MAAALNIYNVSIPCDTDALQEAYRQIEQHKIPDLNPVKTIDEDFPSPAKNQIHIIVRVPGKLLSALPLLIAPPSYVFLLMD
jgi:hypothetical protein